MATSDISKSPLYIDSTNSRVGVGTASPSEVLEVYGTTPIIQINDRGLYQAQIGLIGNDTEFRGSSGNIEFYTGSADGASSTERMRIDTSGNVGIGTSPSELLHIKNASGDAAVRVQGNTRTFNIEQNNYGLRFVDVDAGSAERMRIDAAGNVTMPSQPAFFAYLNGNWGSWTPNNQTQIVPFDLTYYNIGNHFNVNTGLFTCPVAGNYMFSYSTYVGGQNIEQVWLVKAGSRDLTVGFANAGSTGDRAAATQVIRCAANDTVGVCPYGSSATTGTVFSNFYHTFFVGAFIG